MKKLYGMVCAMITPMKEDGSLDLKSIPALCEHLYQGGVHCLYPNGTNGESILLSPQERRTQAEAIQKANAGRCVLYIQCGAVTPEETYDHVRHARKIGADGAGVMTPVFFPTDDQALRDYYGVILKETSDFPLYVYNIFSRTGNDVSASLLGELMETYDNLYGIKFSAPNLLRVEDYVHCCAARTADVLIGNDALALCCLTAGGRGYVSGPGAVFPRYYAAVYDAFREDDLPAARAAQEKVLRLMQRMEGVPEIPAIKYMLWRQDVLSTPVCRRPFRPLDAAEKQQLDDLLVFVRSMN